MIYRKYEHLSKVMNCMLKSGFGGSQDEFFSVFLPFQNGIKNKINFWIICYRFCVDFGTLLEAKLAPKIDKKWYRKIQK